MKLDIKIDVCFTWVRYREYSEERAERTANDLRKKYPVTIKRLVDVDNIPCFELSVCQPTSDFLEMTKAEPDHAKYVETYYEACSDHGTPEIMPPYIAGWADTPTPEALPDAWDAPAGQVPYRQDDGPTWADDN